MEQPESAVGDELVFLCDFCTDTFTSKTIGKHLARHLVSPSKPHAHYLWCTLCSPLLRPSDAHADQHSDHNGEVILNVESDDIYSKEQDDSPPVHDGHYFYSNMQTAYNDSAYLINGEMYFNNLSNTMFYWHQNGFYDGGDILPTLNENESSDPTLVNIYNTSNSQAYLKNLPSNPIAFPSTNADSHFSLDVTEALCVENTVYAESLPETSDAETLALGDTTCTEPLQETPDAEIICSGNVTCVEPHPEIPSGEYFSAGHITYVDSSTDITNAEILCTRAATDVDPPIETAKVKILNSGHTTYRESHFEATSAESHLSEPPNPKYHVDASNTNLHRKDINMADMMYVVSLPETSDTEILPLGDTTSVEPLQDTPDVEIICSGNVTCVEPHPEIPSGEYFSAGHTTSVDPPTDITNAEILCAGPATNVDIPTETTNVKILNSGLSTYRESHFEAISAESHLSEPPNPKYQVDASNTNRHRKGRNMAHMGNGNSRQGGQRHNGRKSYRNTDNRKAGQSKNSRENVFLVKYYENGSDKTCENAKSSSSDDSNRSLSYSAVVKRGLPKRL